MVESGTNQAKARRVRTLEKRVRERERERRIQARGRAIILGGPMPVRDLCAALSHRDARDSAARESWLSRERATRFSAT